MWVTFITFKTSKVLQDCKMWVTFITFKTSKVLQDCKMWVTFITFKMRGNLLHGIIYYRLAFTHDYVLLG